MNILIAIFCLIVVWNLIKPLFQSKPNHSELIEAKLTNSEFRANKRNFK